ncbi:hypothetical protein NKDENANG_01378 [Candidatus Entotheonellaceae bacterium PAL068K]
MVKTLRMLAACWLGYLLPLFVLVGCESLYQTRPFTAPLQTALPVEVADDEVWVTSVPIGAEVYVQPFDPEQIPSHAMASEAHRGTTPVRFSLPPGSYWIEVALEAEVFETYFSPPYDDAQFEQEGAVSEALLFRPFVPREKRRVLRYYHLEKRRRQGQTLIALFHPRGEPLDRVMALYPQQEQYQPAPAALPEILRQVRIPPDVQETFIALLKRGGKAFWSAGDEYRVSLELRPQAAQGHISSLYIGSALPDPLLPDGGGF